MMQATFILGLIELTVGIVFCVVLITRAIKNYFHHSRALGMIAVVAFLIGVVAVWVVVGVAASEAGAIQEVRETFFP